MKPRWLIVFLLLAVLAGGAWWRYYEWRERSQDTVILAAARRYGVDPALVKAIVWRESWFNPRARGSHGESGLMQVTEKAASEWAEAEHIKTFQPEHLLDPATNVSAGAFYLEKLLNRHARTDNPVLYALADYNAGRARVLMWSQGAAATNSAAFIKQIGFPGTKFYVKSVMRRYEHYRLIFPPK